MTTKLVKHELLAASPFSWTSAMSISNHGVALLEQGHTVETQVIFRQFIDSRPRCAEAWNDYGVALYCANDISGAIDCYKQALSLAPGWEGPYVNLGNAYLYLGQINHAVAYYRQALQLNPDLSGVHCNIGGAFKVLGMDVEAEACFQLIGTRSESMCGTFQSGNPFGSSREFFWSGGPLR